MADEQETPYDATQDEQEQVDTATDPDGAADTEDADTEGAGTAESFTHTASVPFPYTELVFPDGDLPTVRPEGVQLTRDQADEMLARVVRHNLPVDVSPIESAQPEPVQPEPAQPEPSNEE